MGVELGKAFTCASITSLLTSPHGTHAYGPYRPLLGFIFAEDGMHLPPFQWHALASLACKPRHVNILADTKRIRMGCRVSAP